VSKATWEYELAVAHALGLSVRQELDLRRRYAALLERA
jgi:hypothetical protein